MNESGELELNGMNWKLEWGIMQSSFLERDI